MRRRVRVQVLGRGVCESNDLRRACRRVGVVIINVLFSPAACVMLMMLMLTRLRNVCVAVSKNKKDSRVDTALYIV